MSDHNAVKYLVIWAERENSFVVAEVQWFDKHDYPEENCYAVYKTESAADTVALMLNELVNEDRRVATKILHIAKLHRLEGTDW